MKSYYITLDGCDASTTVEMTLTEQEYILIKRLSYLTKEESHYSCMPRLEVEAVSEKGEDDD